jgi:hypothetical protein
MTAAPVGVAAGGTVPGTPTTRAAVVEPRPEVRRSRGCFGWGCLVVLGALVLLLACGGLTYFRLPERAGLYQPRAERLLSATPDHAAARSLVADLQRSGIDTRGVQVFVVPIAGTEDSAAMAVLDASQGFQFRRQSSVDPVTDFLAQLATSPTAAGSGIKRVGVDYRGADGASVMTMAASSDAVSAYASGRLTKRQFLEKAELHFDPSALVVQQLAR